MEGYGSDRLDAIVWLWEMWSAECGVRWTVDGGRWTVDGGWWMVDGGPTTLRTAWPPGRLTVLRPRRPAAPPPGFNPLALIDC